MAIILHKTEGSIRHYLKNYRSERLSSVQGQTKRLLGNNQTKIRIEDFSLGIKGVRFPILRAFKAFSKHMWETHL